MRFSISKVAFLVIGSIIFLGACQKNGRNQLIEKEALVDILTELHITDAILANKGWYDAKLKDTTKSYYNYILKKYEISRADFEHSLDYYGKNPEEYLLVYNEVIARINEKMPRKLHENSIYRIFEIAYEDAEILSDLKKYYGKSGREFWKGRRDAQLPKDTASLKLEAEKESKYPCLVAFTFDVKLNAKDTSKNLRAELEISYKDSSKTIDTVFITDNGKKKTWKSYQLVARTDSLKKPEKISARLFEQENDTNIIRLNVRRIALRQYAPDKDTSKLYYPPLRKAKKNNKKARKKVIKNPKKKTNSGSKRIKKIK